MARLQLAAMDNASRSAWPLGCVHSIETMGTVDGPGIRLVVFMQGCPLRCAYCHNPDTWEFGSAHGPGTMVSVEALLTEFNKNRPFYSSGGITVTGGEPLMQPSFVGALFEAAHTDPSGRIHTCLDTSGWPWSSAGKAFDQVLDHTDLVLLDIKHSNAERHQELTERSLEPILAFGDELYRRSISVVIRHVVVPGWTDDPRECYELGRCIGRWTNIVGLEMLPYHTMGLVKYEQLGLPYRLREVPQMDTSHIPALKKAVLLGMKHVRTT